MDELLNNLNNSLIDYAQNDFLSSTEIKLDKILNCCIALLRANGYKVASPELKKDLKISTYKDLLQYFNNLVAIHYGPEFVYYRNDRHIAGPIKNFINKRMKTTGLSLKAAKQECALIIEVLFDNLNEFNFKTPPSVSIFDNAKCSWIIDKVLGIINNKVMKTSADEYMRLVDSVGNSYEQGSGLLDLDALLADAD
ncbi:MAG TPA: hypothetical protein VI911_07850 [Patescibacteria group bacterium]|nr:hypothetical protein [Patescibacteria group bacterium]